MRTKIYLLGVALCCFLISSSWAQNTGKVTQTVPRIDCRTNAGPSDVEYERSVDRNLFKQRMQHYLNDNERRAVVQYAVQIHIVRRDDGTGGIDIADIRDEFDNFINPYFADIDVEFVECNPEEYHNSTEYYILGNGTEDADAAGDAMSAAFNVPNVINIYYVADPDSACGWARFPWKLPVDYIVIANSCADNKSTTVHELGHYFGLYHTHETGNGAESVTRNNADGCWDCEVDGDLLCDTPADPNLSSTANNFPSCAYTGTATDACNGDAYVPQINNIMSYADKACRTLFTSEQQARMEVYRDGDRGYLQTGCPCEKPEAKCKNISINLNAAGSASINAFSVNNGSTYDCGLDVMSVSPASFDCGDVGPNVVTLNVLDDLGWESSCQATVTVVDATDPVIGTAATNMTVECDGNGNLAQYSNWLANRAGATASDACGGSWSDNSTGLSDGCGATGSELVTFTFTDPSGNSASTAATFTIEDNTDPALTCPDDIHLPECVETATWEVISSDICGSVTVVSNPPSGSVFPKGTTTVVNVTSTDDCGNVSACTFEVTRDPDLQVDIDALPTSELNTCALGTNAHIVLGYGGGPTCLTFTAVGSGGHGPYTYSWAAPAEIPAESFTDGNTDSPTFCADFQTAPCVTYTFVVTVTDIHGCTETDDVAVSVVNPSCNDGKNAKFNVCHRPPGDPLNENTLCLSTTATGNHLNHVKHDDCLGACDAVCVSYGAKVAGNNAINNSNKLNLYELSVQPNPFNTTTTIEFSTHQNAEVRLVVIDISGREVATVFSGATQKDHPYTINFDAGDLQSGVYIIRLMDNKGTNISSTIILDR